MPLRRVSDSHDDMPVVGQPADGRRFAVLGTLAQHFANFAVAPRRHEEIRAARFLFSCRSLNTTTSSAFPSGAKLQLAAKGPKPAFLSDSGPSHS
jgi:hypothetical protein